MRQAHKTIGRDSALAVVACLAILAAVPAAASAQGLVDTTPALEQVINGAHRSAEERARDRYRHPLQTLQFFGIQPDMTVVEVYPGGGWYTKILAPFLKDRGTYYAAGYPADTESSYGRRARQRFQEEFVADPETYGEIRVTALDPDGETPIVPDGSADLVLTFRNVHNWMASGFAEQAFNSFYRALKPGGILGVVEHRAPDDEPQDPEADSGYVRQDYVVQLAGGAGFELIDQSEINANPKDTKDYFRGVWTLPPSLRLGPFNRGKYLEIGESDRMTLMFRKPAF